MPSQNTNLWSVNRKSAALPVVPMHHHNTICRYLMVANCLIDICSFCWHSSEDQAYYCALIQRHLPYFIYQNINSTFWAELISVLVKHNEERGQDKTQSKPIYSDWHRHQKYFHKHSYFWLKSAIYRLWQLWPWHFRSWFWCFLDGNNNQQAPDTSADYFI